MNTMQTKQKPNTEPKKWEYRGFIITECFHSKSGTGRTCNTRQSVTTTLPGAKGFSNWNSTLKGAKEDIDAFWLGYLNGDYKNQMGLNRCNAMDSIATSEQRRMRKDAVLARMAADHAKEEAQQKAEKERQAAYRAQTLKTYTEAELWAELERRENTK